MKHVLLPKHGITAHFMPRHLMARRHATRRMTASLPATPLPVDCTGNMTVQVPMDDNDQYGICGPAMCDHVNRVLAWKCGKGVQLNTSVSALLSQYLKISGGDNGTDETMLVGPQGIWTTAGGGIAGDPSEVVIDALDHPGDATTLNFMIDQFFTTEMAWSVPDAFLQEFQTGASFLSPMTPDPANGHYTPLTDLDASGNKRVLTWGGWAWLSQSFINGVDPVFFSVFSANQFDKATGYDAHGRHITTQAALWESIGGKAITASVINAFPPPSVTPPAPAPTPTPTPVPVPPPVPQYAFDLTFNRPVAPNAYFLGRAGTAGIPAGKYGCAPISGRRAPGPIVQEILALIKQFGPVVLANLPAIIAIIQKGGSWQTILAEIAALLGQAVPTAA